MPRVRGGYWRIHRQSPGEFDSSERAICRTLYQFFSLCYTAGIMDYGSGPRGASKRLANGLHLIGSNRPIRFGGSEGSPPWFCELSHGSELPEGRSAIQ